ncbi:MULTISPECIES: monovalent cation/H(+) antiporter subunit G [Petrotoga]|uniref:Multisubunit sodium/proton antiporter MrpG subunit n=1 Tax=Petrotoga sibirica TaxID=156202 RepID=A0A4R8EGT3_9BACT|nr:MULTISPECIES: monovalent cation/H(+) antiporter subunit G [Petrotoga]TDX11094.1 multisubunit sodium/proton antiporter MrpG subunit [Petrotoga sibirica]
MIANILMGIGIIFLLSGTLGLFTMEDFYSKIQAIGIADTVGIISVIISLMLKYPENMGRLLILFIIILVLNPAISSIIAYHAAKSGEKVGRENK